MTSSQKFPPLTQLPGRGKVAGESHPLEGVLGLRDEVVQPPVDQPQVLLVVQAQVLGQVAPNVGMQLVQEYPS